MTEIKFFDQPDTGRWIIPGFLRVDYEKGDMIQYYCTSIKKISQTIEKLLSKKEIIIRYERLNREIDTFLMCFLFRYRGMKGLWLERSISDEIEAALQKELKLLLWVNHTLDYDHAIVKGYRRPLRVLVTGDRNSSNAFKSMITIELKELPYGSVIIHGRCRGIDLFADSIAKSLGIQTESYPVESEDWKRYGLAAGPMRNTEMLKMDIDLVLGFHPDIQHSKGTKDCLIQAQNLNIECYIIDLKYKQPFTPEVI